MIKLIADSSSDLTALDDINFESVPLVISTDTESYRDDENLDVVNMIKTLAQCKGRTYTACPGVNDWLDAYEGADEIYVGVLTSGISGAYQSAMAARDQYLEAHPKARVHVFDTFTTGPELRLLMEKVAELVKNGLPFDDIRDQATAYLQKTRLFFSLQSLHNFAQNGRVSKVLAAAVGLLNIRIVGTASKEGTLEPISKPRGDVKALAELVNELIKAGYNGGKILISHVQNQPLADKFTKLIHDRFPSADVRSYLSRGLCSYYAEEGGFLVGCETNM